MKINRRTINIIQILSWILLLVVSSVIHSKDLSAGLAMLRGITNIGIMCLIYYVHMYILAQFFYNDKKRPYIISFSLILILGGLLRTGINRYLTMTFELSDSLADPKIELFATLLTLTSTLLISTGVHLLMRKIDQEKSILSEINELQSAQLKYLRYQMNPHFLFNSLNTIYGMALKGSERTPNTILELSDLIRYSLYESGDKVVLSKEIAQLEKTISLHSLKSLSSINTKLLIEGNVDQFYIPPMILIPLVENAFKHGDIFMHESAYIKIKVVVKETIISFTCENSYDPQMEKDTTGGIGLQNIQKRLELIYGERFNLDIEEKDASFRVKLELQGSC